QTSISVSGEPVGSIQDPYLPAAQVGDWFMFSDNSERVRLLKKNSSTSWEVSRTTQVAHQQGATLIAECNPGGTGGFPMTYWKFLADHLGQDTTSTSYLVDRYWHSGGHDEWREN